MIDFDGLFGKFMRDWLDRNGSRFANAEQLEDSAAEVYEEWCTTPVKELGDLSPRQYFADITDANRLIEMFGEYLEGSGDVPDLLLDRIGECHDCEMLLIDIVKNSSGSKAMYAMNLLNELQSVKALNVFADLIFDPLSEESELAELASEIMACYPEQSKPLIIERLADASPKAKELAADVLRNCKHDDRIFALLSELFLSGVNYELYAGYLGKYGDERAIPLLKEEAEICDYVSFLEITSAVESLGGDMSDIVRDFSDDPYYKKLTATRSGH